LFVGGEGEKLSAESMAIIAEELNVKEVSGGPAVSIGKDWVSKEDGGIKLSLCLEITAELKKEGLAREIVRAINQTRKEMKLTMRDKIGLFYSAENGELKNIFSEYGDKIKSGILAERISEGDAGGGNEIDIDGFPVKIKISLIK